MYVCVYIHIHTYVFTITYTCVLTYMYTHMCLHLCVCVCPHIHAHVYTYTYIHLYICVCTYVNICHSIIFTHWIVSFTGLKFVKDETRLTRDALWVVWCSYIWYVYHRMYALHLIYISTYVCTYIYTGLNFVKGESREYCTFIFDMCISVSMYSYEYNTYMYRAEIRERRNALDLRVGLKSMINIYLR